MNKQEQVIMGFRDLLNKMILINKDKMEDSLKGFKSSEVHCNEMIISNLCFLVNKIAPIKKQPVLQRVRLLFVS